MKYVKVCPACHFFSLLPFNSTASHWHRISGFIYIRFVQILNLSSRIDIPPSHHSHNRKPTTAMLPILSTIFLLPLLTSASAPITTHNPSSASIQASLSASSPIQGTITGVTPQNGTGTSFNVNFFDFPTTGAPFSYYISDATSIPGGNCSSLTAVFNPYSASGTCKASDPANCAVGALSAKHASFVPPLPPPSPPPLLTFHVTASPLQTPPPTPSKPSSPMTTSPPRPARKRISVGGRSS